MIELILSFAFLIISSYVVMLSGLSESKILIAISVIMFLSACFTMLYFGITNA